MKAGRITCMVAATFVGTVLILGAAGPVHAQPALIAAGRHNFRPEIQQLLPYGDLYVANGEREKGLAAVSCMGNDLCHLKPSS